MSILTGLHGVTAIAVICLFLFVEETGVPVPLLSGDVLLVLAGVLIVNGSVSPWEFFPPAFVAEVAGVMIAHLWSRTLGKQGLQALADKIGAGKALDRAASRLSSASPFHIMVARLVPGLRINTSLVAGAAGVSPMTFLLGVVPAIVIWLAVFTLLGVVVGVPVLGALDRVQHEVVTGTVLILIGVVTVIGVRYIPSADQVTGPPMRLSRRLSLAVAAIVDTAVATSVDLGATELLRVWFRVHGLIVFSIITAIVILAYVGVMRHVIGGTVGERLTGAKYGTK